MREVQRELAVLLIPNDEGGRFVGQSSAEMVDGLVQEFPRYESATKVGSRCADAAVREVGSDRRGDGCVELEPGAPHDEEHAVPPDREAMAGARRAYGLEARRAAARRRREAVFLREAQKYIIACEE